MAKCDLQVHSRFSDRPPEWILRRLGMPESYTLPETIYQKAKAAGMDFVTITDHDTLQGGLEIADRKDVFLSEEVTTHFPDGVKVHILVWGLNEEQHREISTVKNNIFDLIDYLNQKKLAHGVAHPLVSVDGKLTVDHFERLLLLFQNFEGINGLRNPFANEVLQACLVALTSEKIQKLADKHNISPRIQEPWRKSLFGGSDDHGGLFIARAYTETSSSAKTVDDFLAALQNGQFSACGEGGSIQVFASGIYHTAHRFVNDYLQKRAPLYASLLGKMVERFLEGKNPTIFSFKEKVGLVADTIRHGQVFSLLKLGNSIPKDFSDFFKRPDLKQRLDEVMRSESLPERRAFFVASEVSNYLGYRLFKQTIDRMNSGDFLGALQSASTLLPVATTVLPYFVAFQSLFSNRRFLEQVSREFCHENSGVLQNNKRAWFTDTLDDVNGVARTIRTMTRHVRELGHDLTVVTSRTETGESEFFIHNFRPIGEFEIPEYRIQRLSFPPILEMLDYVQKEKFSEIIISTPGPVGVVGLMAAKMFGLPVSGIYHTDFPQYVKILSEDDAMETLTWNYMQWFYGQLDIIYSNSRYYRDLWEARGIASNKLKIFPRGLDTDLFHEKHRNATYWKSKGLQNKVVLYVGRISKEKDLDLIPDIASELRERKCSVSWAFVGDGPFREELQQRMPQAVFTGVVTGEELGIAYASADLFLFPSTTDTYGNVIVEACAAGLPVIVSDVGGPKELVKSGIPGVICAKRNVKQFADAIENWSKNPPKFERPNLAILNGWQEAAKKFWTKED
ncbi:MAG: glycosyltransferase [Verrucomicrobiae bacterium]|nr:glycosyltransferase [Verrucomicrobiae bacterium]